MQIVGVKVNNELYTPSSVSATETTVLIPAGVDLSKAKLQLLVINGTANFINDQEYDARKPLDLTLNGLTELRCRQNCVFSLLLNWCLL